MKAENKRDTDIRFYLFLLAVVAGYSLYFLPYTLFDGFATFSNDAASYVLMGRKWSPFFEPTIAEVFTWPVHPYPPAFALLLALTGASESLWAGHLVVSICLLASLFLIGHYIGEQTDKLIAGLVTVAILSIPGIIVNSLGILSENLYLLVTLAALALYLHIRNRQNVSWFTYLMLSGLLASAVLTRTVGIALLGAFLVVPMVDRTLVPKQRILLPLMALGGIIAWQIGQAIEPGQSTLSYGLYLSRTLNGGRENMVDLLLLWRSVSFNLVKLVSAWSQYLTIKGDAGISFLLTYSLLVICAAGLILRAVRLRLDAIYILFYIGIILFWPVSYQMTRFLHPIAFLLLLQPVLLLSERGYLQAKSGCYFAVTAVTIVLIAHSVVAQMGLLDSRLRTEQDFPALAHSPEYYLATLENDNMGMAKSYVSIAKLMAQSAELIPSDAIVAATKHENFTLLADRKAVALTSLVGLNQQFCNLQLQRVDYVYITNMLSLLSHSGLAILELYGPITEISWAPKNADETAIAYILKINQSALAERLDDSKFTCEEVKLVQ